MSHTYFKEMHELEHLSNDELQGIIENRKNDLRWAHVHCGNLLGEISFLEHALRERRKAVDKPKG